MIWSIINFPAEILDFIGEFLFGTKTEVWDRHPKTGRERKLRWKSFKACIKGAWHSRDMRLYVQNKQHHPSTPSVFDQCCTKIDFEHLPKMTRVNYWKPIDKDEFRWL